MIVFLSRILLPRSLANSDDDDDDDDDGYLSTMTVKCVFVCFFKAAQNRDRFVSLGT